MKKIICVFCLAIAVFTFSSCASKKKSEKSAKIEKNAAPEQNQEEVVEEVSKKKTSKKTKTKSAKKDSLFNLDTEFGLIRLKAKKKLGTFNILLNDENAKSVPVLSSGNEYTTSGFYLRDGRKVYKLNSETDIKTDAVKTENGMRLIYEIDKLGNVTVDFSCLKSAPSSDFDILKIQATVKNTSKKRHELALKCVLDTVLGENEGVHFYTSDGIPVKAESVYRTTKYEKWFLSRNSALAMQILLEGGDITPFESVSLANRITLESNLWEPSITSSRTFDTVTSYNDSAVGLNWKVSGFPPESSKTYTFYIAFSSDGRIPNGEKFLNSMTKPLENAVVPSLNDIEVITASDAPEYSVENSIVEDDFVQVIQKEPLQSFVVESEYVDTKPTVKFDISNIEKSKLTPEYIQSLMNRINALEADASNVNKEELLELNAELDAILEYLRN